MTAFLDYLKAISVRFADELESSSRDVESKVLTFVRAGFAEISEEVTGFLKGVASYGAEHPEPIFSVLRKLQPILVHDRFALVTRAEDVEEVLARDDVFDVPYAERMRLITNGENFFLGMQDGPRYSRDHTNALMMVRREDVARRVFPFVAHAAHSLVSEAGREFDVVTGLTQKVPARLVGDYFGTPGPNEQALIEWASALFWYLFLDQEANPAVGERALAASAKLNAYLDDTIAVRARMSLDRDDAIARALAVQAAGVPGTSALDIRNNLVGLIIGAIPTTATASALALDELLDRPDALAGAQSAAQSGDDSLLARYVFEALRFRPMNPGIFRVANQDFVVAKGERRATTIPAGATVIAATQSAMFDPLVIDSPREFRVDRSARDYMFWGRGLHTCFGKHINQVQIPQILKPLLARASLTRAPGDAGKLMKAGPFAGHLVLTLG